MHDNDCENERELLEKYGFEAVDEYRGLRQRMLPPRAAFEKVYIPKMFARAWKQYGDGLRKDRDERLARKTGS